MTGAELDALADKVADRLREPMVSAALPQEIGDLFRECTSRGGQWKYTMVMPLHNGWGICFDGTINTDGSLTLRLQDINGQVFWQGTFRAP